MIEFMVDILVRLAFRRILEEVDNINNLLRVLLLLFFGDSFSGECALPLRGKSLEDETLVLFIRGKSWWGRS